MSLLYHDLKTSQYNFIVTEAVDGVAKLLVDLQRHKAHGPDEIPACLLNETAYSSTAYTNI